VSWEIVIGLETHAQLSTASKMFSGASTAFGAAPNTQASAVDIALPGVLPVANKGAVERAIRFGLAIGANINRRSVFARKNYFYPDLPKGYQISQFELPIVQGGEISIVSPTRGQIKIRLTRAHLEEDAGKSLHEDFQGMSGIDLNRAGVPLLEIVSEPEMRSAEEAVAYAKKLHEIVTWNDICDGNMQEGSFRCDANVSVRRPGAPLGTRCEIKNLNSFRFLERAIEFEVKRQIEILEDGGKIVQETRLYDPDKDETRSMRTKEEAHDYRYFPDPDLLPLVVSDEWLEREENLLVEQPVAKRDRYVNAYELSAYDADLLTQSRDIAEFFEAVVEHEDLKHFAKPLVAKRAANIISGKLAAEVSKTGASFRNAPIKPGGVAGIVELVLLNRISVSTANNILFPEMVAHGDKPVLELIKMYSVPTVSLFTPRIRRDEAVLSTNSSVTASIVADAKGLWTKDDSAELEQVIDKVIAASPAQVADYRAGKDKAFNSLVGQVMKATQGKANPAQVNEILKRKLGR
jgi:aspartyl-tRNA(Asn)/glutamyl-tRNA(Gln) amidotransferase subunit B